MKKTTLFAIVASSLGLFPAGGQPFQNLGFESATIVPIDDWSVQWNPAMPGWTGSVRGGNQVSSLFHRDTCLSSCTGIFIIDQPTIRAMGGHLIRPLAGQYSVMLEAGLGFAHAPPYDASIAQTGVIPLDAQSLRFVGLFGGTAPPVVSLGGQALSLHTFAGPGFTLYAADVSAFAGQTAELRFTVTTDHASAQQGRGSAWLLDAISFSAVPVPEPSVVFLLLMIGGCVLARSCKRSDS